MRRPSTSGSITPTPPEIGKNNCPPASSSHRIAPTPAVLGTRAAPGRESLHWGYEKKLFLATPDPAAFNWTVGIVEAKVTGAGAAPQSVTFALDSYCPNLIAYEANIDNAGWTKLPATPLSWPLHTGTNTLRLRTLSAGQITGPEFSAKLELTK